MSENTPKRQAVTIGAIGIAAAIAGSAIGGTAAGNAAFERHIQAQPVQSAPAQSAPAQPVQSASTQPAPAQSAPAQSAPVQPVYRATETHAQDILALTDTPAGIGLQPATADELHSTGVRPIHVAPNTSSQVVGVIYQADCSTIGIGGVNPNATPAQFVHANEVRRAAEAQHVVDDEGHIWYPIADTSLWVLNDGFCL